MATEHDGVDHQGPRDLTTDDGLDDGGRSQCAGLRGLRGKIFHHGVDLSRDQARVEGVDARDTGSVLDGYEGYGRSSEDFELVEGLEVGLDACAAAGVGTGDGEGDRDHWPSG